MRIIVLIITWVIFSNTLHAQESRIVFSPLELESRVRKCHPFSRQADLLVENAKADLLQARAPFDPLFSNETGQKNFSGEMYYYYNRSMLSFPTIGGVELKTGTLYNSGSRMDVEDTRGLSNFWSVSVPLAKDLLMDKRRATLRVAKVNRQASELQRKTLLNDILLEAMEAYWNWKRSYQVLNLMENAYRANLQRLQMVKTAHQLGDRPAVDTIEAFAQLQKVELVRNQLKMEFQNAGLYLSAYLWNENLEPVEVGENWIPEEKTSAAEFTTVEELIEKARMNHPELLQFPFKLKALEIEKKLKFQELLPEARFQYSQLGKGSNPVRFFDQSLFGPGFQYALSIGIPLRLSKGRAEFRKAAIRIRETELLQANKFKLVETKIRALFNEWQTLGNQVNLQEKACSNYSALQRAEELRFRSGESSLFLVNARENQTLEALQKLRELENKYQLSVYKIYWAVGLL